jgi:hypothetical protein
MVKLRGSDGSPESEDVADAGRIPYRTTQIARVAYGVGHISAPVTVPFCRVT